MNHIIIDIETAPLDFDKYGSLSDDDKLKLLNPIDSRIVAIGFHHDGLNNIFIDVDEKVLLQNFWEKFNDARTKSPGCIIVGFNIISFDIPFITTRSFVNNVQVTPFKIKHVIDLREKISAYRSGRVRGSLKDLAGFIGISSGENGSMVFEWWKSGEYEKIKLYLQKDLVMTEAVYQRAKDLRILEIEKW
ncbi:ribonuclease H-like domain-containing protein [Candidatus Woesearchaeota archaeon]|nr:ribonuclease H-like domain-containing protein [Candidatus Woesearchaeota archaeon]